jgi:biotin operon repressor
MKNDQTNDEYLNEIAAKLGCHRAFIIETITQIQEDLKDAEFQRQLGTS